MWRADGAGIARVAGTGANMATPSPAIDAIVVSDLAKSVATDLLSESATVARVSFSANFDCGRQTRQECSGGCAGQQECSRCLSAARASERLRARLRVNCTKRMNTEQQHRPLDCNGKLDVMAKQVRPWLSKPARNRELTVRPPDEGSTSGFHQGPRTSGSSPVAITPVANCTTVQHGASLMQARVGHWLATCCRRPDPIAVQALHALRGRPADPLRASGYVFKRRARQGVQYAS